MRAAGAPTGVVCVQLEHQQRWCACSWSTNRGGVCAAGAPTGVVCVQLEHQQGWCVCSWSTNKGGVMAVWGLYWVNMSALSSIGSSYGILQIFSSTPLVSPHIPLACEKAVMTGVGNPQ